jgi:hypothetical protein
MSERLTEEWTETLEEAFGASGVIGTAGENFVVEAIRGWGWECDHYVSDRDKQEAGIDISFRKPSWSKPYTADVKANMDASGNFYVDTASTGWLFASKKYSDRIWHVNVNTGSMAWYGRDEMKDYIITNAHYNTGSLQINSGHRMPFITRRTVKKVEENV